MALLLTISLQTNPGFPYFLQIIRIFEVAEGDRISVAKDWLRSSVSTIIHYDEIPYFLQIIRKGRSVTPAIGANIKLFSNSMFPIFKKIPSPFIISHF